MRGRGIGSVLSGLFRTAVPLLKSGGKAILKEGAKTGLQVAQDLLAGKNFGTAIKRRGKGAGQRLVKKAIGQFKPPAPPGEPAVKRIKKRKAPKRKTKPDIFD